MSMIFDTAKDLLLENERVLLRPLSEADFKHLLPFAENEPEIWLYSLIPADGSENLKTYLDIALEKRLEGDSYQKYAGTTRFYDIQRHHNTLQLGYTWYGKDFQGTGLNKNCKFLLLKFAFETLEVERVEFRADALNARSIAAMKSIGCKEEGILRSNCKSTTGRRDSIILSILKSEWEFVKNNLKTRI